MKKVIIPCVDGDLAVVIVSRALRIEEDYSLFLTCCGMVKLPMLEMRQRIASIYPTWPDSDCVQLLYRRVEPD